MSNLSQRVEKAKKLEFSHNPYFPGRYGTWGSKDSKTFGLYYYHVNLSKTQGTIYTPDGKKDITVLLVDCRSDDGTDQDNCPDCKYNKAICKHGLGALRESFKSIKKLISFYDNYEAALKMSFGHKVYKVQNKNTKGHCWAVVKDWPKSNILSAEENIDLMRGSEDEEGID